MLPFSLSQDLLQINTQAEFTRSKLTKETPEEFVKSVQS